MDCRCLDTSIDACPVCCGMGEVLEDRYDGYVPADRRVYLGLAFVMAVVFLSAIIG